jgi:murein DD-endopeptidase MepM/ murein hydrolase activator NlpD
MRLKPGWYLLGLALLYALIVTGGLQTARRQVASLGSQNQQLQAELASGPKGYILPLPGACIPTEADNLPGAARPYRKGVNAGFIFQGSSVCTPVIRGIGVVAAGSGKVIRADIDYRELGRQAFDQLLTAVGNGANPDQLAQLRGREIWIEHPDGSVTVYGHLSLIAPQIKVGQVVQKGDWIGRVGNSGTFQASQASAAGPRLLFEHWSGQPDQSDYFGKGLSRDDLIGQARQRYTAALR